MHVSFNNLADSHLDDFRIADDGAGYGMAAGSGADFDSGPINRDHAQPALSGKSLFLGLRFFLNIKIDPFSWGIQRNMRFSCTRSARKCRITRRWTS